MLSVPYSRTLTAYIVYTVYWFCLFIFPDGPKDMVVNVTPVTSLTNGTLFVAKGTTVIFNCSSKSYPSQNMTWTFEDVTLKENKSRAFGSKSFLHFEILNIQPEDQRNYTCLTQNSVSNKTKTQSVELLIYCMAYKLLHYNNSIITNNGYISDRWALYEHYMNVISVGWVIWTLCERYQC